MDVKPNLLSHLYIPKERAKVVKKKIHLPSFAKKYNKEDREKSS